MFRNVFKFDLKRTWQQALGFYLVCLVIGLLLCTVAGAIAGIIGCSTDKEHCKEVAGNYGSAAGFAVQIIYAYILTITILCKKNLLKSWYSLFLIPLIFLAPFGGLILNLIPASYITTRNIRNNESQPTIH